MCTSPMVRYRYKYRVKYPLIPIPSSESEYVVTSQKKLESRFDNFGSFLDYCNRYLDYQFIPCRKCDECKAKYAQDWSIRCYHESIVRGCCSFITLTIDSAKCSLFIDKIKNSYRNGTNTYCKRCIRGNRFFNFPIDYSLNKFLIYDWLKSFRDYLYRTKGITFRYFGCGEYGEQDERPHYHILIFGYDFPDKHFFRNSSKGCKLFLSEELSSQWLYGLCTVQECNFQTCMYTAKYCTKKLKFDDAQSEYEYYYGRTPEFLFMSKGNCQVNRCDYIDDIIKNCKDLSCLRDLKNPYCINCDKTRGGLGYDWLLRYYDDVLKLGYIVIDGCKYSIPKYYLEIIKLTNKSYYDKYKLTSYLEREKRLTERPLEHSTERLNVKSKVKRSKVNFYKRQLS